MRAPLRGRHADARRLAARLRELARTAASGQAQDPGAAPPSPAPEPPSPAPPDRAEDAAARLDAARRRLRSSIAPREDEDGDGDEGGGGDTVR